MDIKDKSYNCVTQIAITPKVASEQCENYSSAASSNSSRELNNDSVTKSPILGHYFKLPDFSKSFDPDPPILDSSLPYIPVYTHLVTHDLIPIQRPPTPPIIIALRSSGTVQSKERYKSRSTLTPLRINGCNDRAESINHSGRFTKYGESEGTSSIRDEQIQDL